MNQTGTKASLADAALFLSLLAHPGEAFELRALVKSQGAQHVNSGYFDDMQALAAAAVQESGRNDGVYVTINPVHTGLLSRAPRNRVHRGGTATSDRDVVHRRSILVDVDPVRPAGISSTDDEHRAALALAEQIATELGAEGWPDPILADSGNGGHLIYAVDLPVDDAGLVKRVLERLDKRFSTPALKVDKSVFNPARISKIYGTLTRKGEDTAERPHRFSRILRAPKGLVVVSRDRLDGFAPATPIVQRDTKPTNGQPTNGQRDYLPRDGRPAFDVDTWIARHLPDAELKPWSEGRKWILPVCPFNSSHDRGEAFITEKTSGMVAAGCLHESCFKTWKELRERFDPQAERSQRANGSGHQHAPTVSHREPPPEVVYQHPSYDSDSDIDAFADRDREPPVAAVAPVSSVKRPPVWRIAPALVDDIWNRKDDPWISLVLGDDELCRVRAGGIVVVMGGSGSGKSSLVSNLLEQHARNVGPAIVLSIELPGDEFGARLAGMKCDASWEEVLRGQLPGGYQQLAAQLALPRLYVIDRKSATIENLAKCIRAAREAYPGQPILCAIDYAQLLQSKEREARMRVADAFAQIDDVSRDERVVSIAVSQMSRAGADAARSGEKIGADAANLGAESAAIERFASITLTIGQMGEPREDGSRHTEVSLGKGRMSGGDVVFPGSYWGRSGRWRIAGDATAASKVRESRDIEKEERKFLSIRNQLLGVAVSAAVPMSREALIELIHLGSKAQKRTVVGQMVSDGTLVEVAQRAPRSKAWCVWTAERAKAAGIKLAAEASAEG